MCSSDLLGERGIERRRAAEEQRLLREEALAGTEDEETRRGLLVEEYVGLGLAPEEAERQADFDLAKEKERATAEPDAGRGEPDVSGLGGADVVAGAAPAPAGLEPGAVGGVSVPSVEPAPVAADEQSALTPKTFVDRFIAGDFRNAEDTPPEVLQYLTNNGPEIEAEFASRKVPVAEAAPVAPASVIPPIEEVSPQAQIIEQLAPVVEPAAPVPAPAVEEAAPIAPAPVMTPKLSMKERTALAMQMVEDTVMANPDRKSTRLNSSH